MTDAAGLTVPHSIGAIFVNYLKCMGFYLGNGITKVGHQIFNCLWFG